MRMPRFTLGSLEAVKVVILAGGYGTRISEESAVRPKPMVEIGGRPILWHVMKTYDAFGLRDFVICCGYKGNEIKRYFATYRLDNADFTIDLTSNEIRERSPVAEAWNVTLVDTGDATLTGGRLKRVTDYLDDETFCFTYGDCLADIDIGKLLEYHRSHDTLATVTVVQPPGRFGAVMLEERDRVSHFAEKPKGDGGWVNGGFFVLEPGVLDYIDGDETIWERDPLERLAHDGKLAAYRHESFWQPMDTLRDKMVLEEHWNARRAPWKVWSD
jgi:glucose-1-phosphate cytidylyltransferase